MVSYRLLLTLAEILARVFGQDPPPLRRRRGPVSAMISASKLQSFRSFSPLPRFTQLSQIEVRVLPSVRYPQISQKLPDGARATYGTIPSEVVLWGGETAGYPERARGV